jgi:hypothetical protein
MPRERFAENDPVVKRNETGVVVKRVSHRTGREYLTVSIKTGPRKGSHEFPELGWEIDDGRTADPGRPAHDDESYIGSQAHKTRHHAR